MFMKNSILKKLICALTVCILFVGVVPVSAEANTNTVSEAQSLIDSIVNYNLKESGAFSVQNWVDGSLTTNAGSSEWYILALSQNGNYDFSAYQAALKNYLNKNAVGSATSRQKYALAFIATGSADTYISSVMENSIGQQGIMSWIFGLHLLNNGYTSSAYTAEAVKQKLLGLQLADGGWAVSGTSSDVDPAAMAVQALAPYYKSDSAVKSAIEKALSMLSAKQLSTGDFASYGVPNPESTAQVITALSALGIDGENDDRFIKNGNTLFDGLRKYQLSDGSFCHKEGGSSSGTATVQTFYSLVSYIRMASGKTGLYILDNRNPSALPTVTPSTPGTSSGSTPSGEETPSQTQQPSNQVTHSEDSSQAVVNHTEIPEQSEEKAGEDVATNEDVVEKTESQSQKANSGKKKGNYKPWTSLIIVGLAVVACLVLYLAKKRNKKNFIAVLIAMVLAIGFVWVTDFQSTDEYYSGEGTAKENVIGTVTMTIRCDTVAGKSDSENIPENGVVLDTVEFEIEKDDTVYDILTEAAQKYNIQMENSGAEGMVYISGLNYLYEFDFGELSGWMYFVNGEASNVGCDEHILKDGDFIEWLYTCDLGKDLE